jgi:hypothetical protein
VYGGMKSPKQYAVVVSGIDNLVADIMRSSSWNPAFAGTNEAILEAIRRYNNHAEFLTSRYPSPIKLLYHHPQIGGESFCLI